MELALRPVAEDDLSQLLVFMKVFHELEHISMTDKQREAAIRPLLGENENGRIWMIVVDGNDVGYIVLGFGYSIEFGGRDAFIDEFFIQSAARGQGIGRQVLKLVKDKARKLGVSAVHLEVAHANKRAQHLYRESGFDGREQYYLMSVNLNG